MYATGIDLSEMKRVQIIEQCNACLADAVDLQLHCKHAHWNVKGPNFIALHQLFEQIAYRAKGVERTPYVVQRLELEKLSP